MKTNSLDLDMMVKIIIKNAIADHVFNDDMLTPSLPIYDDELFKE